MVIALSSDPCVNLYEEIYRLADKIYTIYYSSAGIEISSSRGTRISIACNSDSHKGFGLIVRLYGVRYSEAGVYEDLYGETELKGSAASRFLEALESLLMAERLSIKIRERYLEKRMVSHQH